MSLDLDDQTYYPLEFIDLNTQAADDPTLASAEKLHGEVGFGRPRRGNLVRCRFGPNGQLYCHVNIIDLNTQPVDDVVKPSSHVPCSNFIDLSTETQNPGTEVVGQINTTDQGAMSESAIVKTLIKRLCGRVGQVV